MMTVNKGPRQPGRGTANAKQQFIDAMRASGINPPATIVADGKLHRFASNGKSTDDAGWYVFYENGLPAGAFGCWRTGINATWHAKAGREVSAQEREALRQRMAGMWRQREDDARNARLVAEEIWFRAKIPPPCFEHVYLSAKSVKLHGLRVHRDLLVVPMRIGKTLHSLQFIDRNGDKTFLAGGRTKGCYFAIGFVDQGNPTLCICEGYATGASIYEATGYATAVAFSAGNLLLVAQTLRAKHKDARIIICADNDVSTPSNPGLTKAREAAVAVNATLAVPPIAGDFNDLMQKHGTAAVREHVNNA